MRNDGILADMTENDDLFDIFGSSLGNGSGSGDNNGAGTASHNDDHDEGLVDADSYFGNGTITDPDNIWGSLLGYDHLGSGDANEDDAPKVQSDDSSGPESVPPPPLAPTIHSGDPEEQEEVEEARGDEGGSSDGKAKPSGTEEEASELGQGNDADADEPVATTEADVEEGHAVVEDVVMDNVEPAGSQAENDPVGSDISADIAPATTADMEPDYDTIVTGDTAQQPRHRQLSASSHPGDSQPDTTQPQDVDMLDAAAKRKKKLELEEQEYEDEADDGEDDEDEEEAESADEESGADHAYLDDDVDFFGKDDAPFVSSKDMVMPGDGSRLEVILDALPEERQNEYDVLEPSRYVYRIVTRVRGRSRYIIEFDDGRSSEVSFWSGCSRPCPFHF